MTVNKLPDWAVTALASGPIFGSEDKGEQPAEAPDNGKKEAPEANADKTVEENANPQLTPEQISKLIRENNETKASLSALQQEKTEREAAEEEARRATASKEENLTKDVQRLTEENQVLATTNERNLLKLAILENTKYQWNDPADVALMIDRTDIKIDPAKGTVDGVDAALKDLAKRKPYMLKQSEENAADDMSAPIPGQPSGGKPSNSADSSAKANKRKQLEARFSVLKV